MEKTRIHRVYLTGFMGSGKSTIAPILANTLGYSAIDIDLEIEKITGKKITSIFSDFGEKYFRDIERTLLHKVSQFQGCVISLGGGTISHEDNLKIIKETGILVYLKTEPERIFQRLKHKTDRPLLKNQEGLSLSDEELNNRINLLLIEREPFYRHADVTIRTDNKRIGLTVDEIVRSIQKFID